MGKLTTGDAVTLAEHVVERLQTTTTSAIVAPTGSPRSPGLPRSRAQDSSV